MTTLTFYNGLREIGGTFVVVETDEARCMFDFGFAVMDRMDDKIAVRYNECAADYARLGVLASQDGIYDEETAKTLGLVSFENDKKKNFFYVENKSGQYVIDCSEIFIIERRKRKLLVMGENGKLLCSFYGKLEEAGAKLPDHFFQCHNSILVNFRKARSISSEAFLMIDGSKVAISRSHKNECKSSFARFCSERRAKAEAKEE